MQTRRVWMMALCGLGVTISSAAGAEDSNKPPKDPAAVRELTVSPRAIEIPLMKYRLLPAEYELRDGNAAPILLRFPWDQAQYFSTVVPTFSEYLDVPLDDPKLLGAENVFGTHFYNELRRAAFRRTAEWEYGIGEKPLAYTLLPDVQGARDIVGRGLSVWIRYHIAHGKLDDAREGILVGIAVSRHYARTPFVITQLVSAAIDRIMLDRLEELLEHPDCPNMYWALTALPRPLIDLRPSVEQEQRFLEMTVSGLDNLDELQTEDQWTKRAEEVIQLLDETAARQQQKQILERLAKRGRAELPDSMGDGADRVAAMSDPEAGLRWLLNVHNEQRHEISALMSLEPPAAIPRLSALKKRLADFRSELGLRTLFVLEKPLDAYVTAYGIQRRIDALRVVEAIRNYATTHQSRLPESLDQIDAVDTPIPNDVLTGEPFRYEVIEGVASLRGNVHVGKELGAIHYRIRVRE